MRRIALVGVIAAAGTVALAAPAQATAAECTDFLARNGYAITTVRAKACAKADALLYDACVDDLTATNIPLIRAREACELGRSS